MGAVIRFRNMKDMPCILKIPELILTLIIAIIAREGGHAADDGSIVEAHEFNIPWGETIEAQNLGAMTTYGFLLIVLGQTCGYLCGERSMVQNGVINLVGGFCFISIGSLQINFFKNNDSILLSPEYVGDTYRALALTNGALAILNGFVWLSDALYCLVQVYYD